MSDSLQDIDLSALHLDPPTRELWERLLNHVESLLAKNKQLLAENQHLKDEIARLKGQKGRPRHQAEQSTATVPTNSRG